MFDMSVSKNTRSPTFWRKSAIDPGVTVVEAAAAVSCWLLLQAAMTSIIAMAAKALIVLIFHRLLKHRPERWGAPGSTRKIISFATAESRVTRPDPTHRRVSASDVRSVRLCQSDAK